MGPFLLSLFNALPSFGTGISSSSSSPAPSNDKEKIVRNVEAIITNREAFISDCDDAIKALKADKKNAKTNAPIIAEIEKQKKRSRKFN